MYIMKDPDDYHERRELSIAASCSSSGIEDDRYPELVPGEHDRFAIKYKLEGIFSSRSHQCINMQGVPDISCGLFMSLMVVTSCLNRWTTYVS